MEISKIILVKLYILPILVLFYSLSDTYLAKVIGITDGDSIIILTKNNTQLKIRLEGIDCPENKQAFGQQAKQTTAALCFNKMVRIVSTGKDRYGRTLAFIYVGDLCINKELLKQGMAWHYKKYNKDIELAKIENEAKAHKIGLWSQPTAIPPWLFRTKKK